MKRANVPISKGRFSEMDEYVLRSRGFLESSHRSKRAGEVKFVPEEIFYRGISNV